MKQLVLSQFNLPWIPITALLLFVACFVLYVCWAYAPKNRTFFEGLATLPLEEKGNAHVDAE